MMTLQITLMSSCFASGREAEREEKTEMPPSVRKHVLTQKTFMDFPMLSLFPSDLKVAICDGLGSPSHAHKVFNSLQLPDSPFQNLILTMTEAVCRKIQ